MFSALLGLTIKGRNFLTSSLLFTELTPSPPQRPLLVFCTGWEVGRLKVKENCKLEKGPTDKAKDPDSGGSDQQNLVQSNRTVSLSVFQLLKVSTQRLGRGERKRAVVFFALLH